MSLMTLGSFRLLSVTFSAAFNSSPLITAASSISAATTRPYASMNRPKGAS
jgi:hypothetical protein